MEGSKKMRFSRDLPNMTDKDLVELVVADAKESRQHNAEQHAKFNRWYNQYRSYIEIENIRQGANLFIPYTFSLVETAVPKWFNSLFGSKPYTNVLPSGEADDEAFEKAKKIDSLLSYQLDQRIGIVGVGNDTLKCVGIYGYCNTINRP